MRSLAYFAGLLALSLAAIAVAVRLVPVRVEVHHVDPATVTPPSSPNFVLLRGEEAASHPADVAETARRLDAAIVGAGGTRLAGDLAQGHASYVFRTRIMGFPDVVSIRLLDASARERLPDGALTEIEIFSRSLIGYGDMGVNRARVLRLLSNLGS